MSGMLDSLKSRLRAMSRSIFRREKIFVFERTLTDACFKIEAKVEVDARPAQHDDFPKISKRFKKFDTIAEERFKIGHICIVSDMHGDIVHLKWIAFNEAYAGELERKLRIDPDSAYIYDTYTVPEYRGLGIAPKVMEKAFSYLYERGIRKVYVCIRHNNFPSLRAAQKEGFRKIGSITYTRIFMLRLYRCKGETKEDYNKLKEMFSL